MNTSRKKFLQQATLAFGGTFIAQSKIFANFSFIASGKRLVKNTISPSDCSQNLRDGYLFPNNSDIKVTDDFYYYAESPASSDFHDVFYAGDNAGSGGNRYALRYKVYCLKNLCMIMK